jgi:hypothetical protein
MIYLVARLNEQLGNSDIALKYLKKAARLGYTSSVRWFKIHQMNDPVFSALREKKEFKEIIEIMNFSDKPIHKSQYAFTVKDKTFGTEGITYDPVEKMFYLGGAHKIVKVDRCGNSVDFTGQGRQDGLGWVNGIHVDPARRTLWACSNDENRIRVGIFKYNLSSGKLIKKYILPYDRTPHMFNDLVIHPNGDVYITDDSGIYMISYSSDKLELFFKNKSLTGPNGITLAGNGKVLFVAADCLGICKIDLKTRSFTRLTERQWINTFGIDGLYYVNSYLYAVQNLLLCQVSRFSLNKDATHIESCEIFEKNTNDLRAPTTGVIVGDYFYFIADSQGRGSKKQGVSVMKIPLK